jgi:hypothetical protein
MGAAELHGHACGAHLSRRAPFVLLLGVVAALTTLPVSYAHRGIPEYRARVEFFVHPGGSTSVHHVPDAMRVLGDDGSVIGTVTGMADSDGFLATIEARAGVAHGVRIDATHASRSDVVAVTVSGRAHDDVVAVARQVPPAAREYVMTSFGQYDVDALGTTVARKHGFPPPLTIVLLAFTVGVAAALGFAFVEWASARRNGVTAPTPASTVVPIR